MKKIAVIMLFFFTFFTLGEQAVQAAAAPWPYPESQSVRTQSNYYPNRDVYRLNYGVEGMPDSSRLNFWSPTGTYYKIDSANKPSGLYYLTCNGTYILELFKSGTKVAETGQIVTTKIQQPSCQSYSNAEQAKNDLNIKETKDANGNKTLEWDAKGDSYEIWKDGDLVTEIRDTKFIVGSVEGSFTIVAKDKAGNIVGESDVNVSPSNGTDPVDPVDPTKPSCDACKWLTDMLACPAWDDYMGEWETMLKRVYQPPNWQQVANIMRDTIVPAMGQELVNRTPEIAKIIADELQSREKPVSPPPSPPTVDYKPPQPLPTLPDLPSKVETDITTNVPNFEPDYSESSGFVLQDPLDMKLSDEDAGYSYDDKPQTTSPPYNQVQKEPEPEKKYNYNWFNVPESNLPDYKPSNPSVTAPVPTYAPKAGADNGAPPNYQSGNSNSAPPDYQTNENNEIPKYGEGSR